MKIHTLEYTPPAQVVEVFWCKFGVQQPSKPKGAYRGAYNSRVTFDPTPGRAAPNTSSDNPLPENVQTLREKVYARLYMLTGQPKSTQPVSTQPVSTQPVSTNMRVVVAVSGGGDSLALLYLLTGLAGLTLELAHFDHQLRPDSAEDAAFVREHAQALHLNYHEQHADIARIAKAKSENVEQTARTLRYAFLHRVAKTTHAHAIVTAHTQNDQAETVLMQLLRGAGLLTGMPAKRGLVVRPLLDVSRQQLRNVLSFYDLTPREDPTNADTSRLRAWCRAVLLPLCETRNPQIIAQLAHLASVQTDIETHFDDRIKSMLTAALELSRVQKQPAALQRHLLLRWLEQANVPTDRRHIEQLRDLIQRADDKAILRLSLPKDYVARLHRGWLEHLPPHNPTPTWLPHHDLPADAAIKLLQQHHGSIDPPLNANQLTSFAPLSIRRRQLGDRIRLAAGSKKLSDLLIDAHVPKEDRDTLTLLAHEQQVLWVEGVAADMRIAAPREPSAAERWMRVALEEAQLAAERGEVPVGAVVVCKGEIIAQAGNRSEQDQDPSAHAEMLAIRQAASVRGSWRLTDCTLVVTLEPCVMCLGAIMQAHINKVIFGAENIREGALGGVGDVLEHPWKRTLTVQGDILADESRYLLQQFFAARRSS